MKNKKNIVIGLAVIVILAVVALFASGKKAKAQTSSAPQLNFYGRIDAGIQSYDNGTDSIIRTGESGMSTSLLGIRGNSPEVVTKLGGLQFKFQLEGGLRPNSAQLGSTTTTGAIFAREAWVGVDGGAGEIRLGTTDISNSTEIDTLVWQFNNFSLFPVNGTAIEIGSDSSNVVKYISPVFHGIQLQAGHSANAASATTDSKSNITSGSLEYKQGPVKLGVGYATKKATTSAGEIDAKSIGGAYDFGKISVGAAYIHGDNSTTGTVKSSANVYSVRVPLPDGLAAHAVYATAKDGAQTTANEGRGYTLGLTKAVAPSANAYVAYTKVDNDANSTMYMPGMGAVPNAGKDPILVMVGINYAF